MKEWMTGQDFLVGIVRLASQFLTVSLLTPSLAAKAF